MSSGEKTSPMTTSDLRNSLKTGLQNAKNLFDDNLIDETELKRLKDVEICKYEAALAALRVIPKSTEFVARQELKTPPHKGQFKPRFSADENGISSEPRSAPQLRKRQRYSPGAPIFTTDKQGEAHTVFLEPGIYSRLVTPPILRRQRRRVRRVVMPIASWRDGLQQHRSVEDFHTDEAQEDSALWKEAQALLSEDRTDAPAADTHA